MEAAQRPSPRFSVIVPVYNGQETLRECLEALCRQTVPREQYEILVIDDGSTDATASIAREFSSSVRLIQLGRNQGRIVARAAGTREAAADLLMFCDSRVILEPDVCEKALALPDRPIMFGSDCPEDAQKSLFGRFFLCLYHWLWKPYVPQEWYGPELAITPENFDRVRKGLGFFVTDRVFFLRHQPATTDRHVSDDTLLFASMVREAPIHRRSDLRCHYRQRTDVWSVIRHLHQRGPLFTSYHIRPGRRYFNVYLALWAIVLGCVAAIVAWPAAGWMVGAAVLACWVGVAALWATSAANFLVVLALLPVVVVAFGSGIIRGHWIDFQRWRRQRERRSAGAGGKTRWAVLAVLVIAGVYALNMDTRWVMGRDSALYLGMGESFAAGHGPLFNGEWWPGLSPGLPLVWAGILQLLGPNYLAGRTVMVAMALLTMAAGYLLVCDRRNWPVPLLVLVLLACNGQMFESAGTLLTDLPFTALLTLTVLGLYRALAGRLVLAVAAGAIFGLAFLMRLEALVVLPLLAVGVLLDGSATKNWRRRLLAVGLFLVSVAPVLVGWYVWYRSASQVGSHGYFKTAADKLGGPFMQILRTIAGNLPELPVHLMGLLTGQRPAWYLAAPLCCVVIPGVVASWRRREMLLLVLGGGYVLFHLAWDVSSINSRYLLPILPLVALWLVDGVRAVFDWVARVRPRWVDRISARFSTASIVAALAAVSLIPMLVEACRWKFQATPCQVRSKRDAALCDVAVWIRGRLSDHEVVVARESSILHYLTGRRVLLPPIPATGQSDEEFRGALEQVIDRATVLVVGPDDDARERTLNAWVQAHGPQVELLVTLADYRVYRRRG